MYYDFSSSLPTEGVGAELPSFQPSLQEQPEVFEKDLDDNLDLDAQFPTPDDLLHIFPDMIPPSPALAWPSTSIYTTESSAGPATSDCLSTPSISNYPARFDFGSQLNAVDPKRIMFSYPPAFLDSSGPFDAVDPKRIVFSDPSASLDSSGPFDTVDPKRVMFSDPSAFLDSSGPQSSPGLFPDSYITVAEAQNDDGPDRPPPVGISPYTLSTIFQGATLPRQMDPPVCATSTKQSRTGPIRTKHICPHSHCGLILTSGRESNLRAHIKTHDPNREKPFVCPENDCGHPFVRSNDFTRHLQSRHGYQKEAAIAAKQRLVKVRRPGKCFEQPGMVRT